MTDFKIIESEDKNFIEKSVKELLEGGYKLNGPLYVFHVHTSEGGTVDLKYIQSLNYDDEI